jgi:hypothetical protein
MTKPYFRQVPNFDYVSRNPGEKYISEYIPVKNLFKRGKIREDIFGDLQFFEKYSIIGDERPDNVANKFYGDSTLDWVVLLSNNILNIQSEWPMTQQTFDKVMLERYGSYDNLYNIRYYETEEIKNSLDITVLKAGLKIPNSWKTNGNFLEMINTKIASISATDNADGVTKGSTAYVYTVRPGGIRGLQVGDQITLANISERQYNGQHIVTSIIDADEDGQVVYGFTFEFPFIPNVAVPRIAQPPKEEVHYTISEQSLNPGNSYYYEFWDPGLGYANQIPAIDFVREVTNYEYELNSNESKRNIYILKPRYLNVIFNDMDDIMPYKRGSQQYVSETLKRGDNIRLYT